MERSGKAVQSRGLCLIVLGVASLLLAGCGAGTSAGNTSYSDYLAGGPSSGVGSDRGDAPVPGGGSAPGGSASVSAFPRVLVATWSGDDASRVGSWYLTFDPAGRYSLRNERRGAQITGRAAVSGGRITFQPTGGAPHASSISVSGGRLTLDGSVYLRVGDAPGGSVDVVGSWLSTDETFTTLHLSADGRFRMENPVDGDVAGTYTVRGSTLTLLAAGRKATPLRVSVSDGVLRLGRPDGTVSEYVRRG
jgi:hypothetical protein